jgi:hypothetical protein
VVAEE